MSREAWKAARAELDIVEAERDRLLEPIREKLDVACEKLAVIEETTGVQLFYCEGCSEPIFAGEPYHSGEDVSLCAECAPSYADMAASPQNFRGDNDEPMTKDEAETILRAHVLAGGSPDDKMVTP